MASRPASFVSPAPPPPAAVHAPAIGTFAPPKPERLALLRADALLARQEFTPAEADAVIALLDAARATKPAIGYDCECAAATLLGKTQRPLAAASRWQRAARAAPLVEHAANAQRMASLLAGAAGHRTRLVFTDERWPLKLLQLAEWAPATLAWAACAPPDEDTARAVALVAWLGTDADKVAAQRLQTRRAVGLDILGEQDRAALVAIVLRLKGPQMAKGALVAARAAGRQQDAVEWQRLAAEIASKERRYDEALDGFRAIVSRGMPAEQARALGRIGQILETQEHFAEAATAYRRASALTPSDAEREEWLYATGVMHVFAGEMAQALGAFERYKNANTSERHGANVLWFSAWSAFRLYDLQHARVLLTELAGTGDATLVPQAEYWLGRLHALVGQTTKAAAWFRKAASHARSYYALLALGRLPPVAAKRFGQAAVDSVGVNALAWSSPLGRRLSALEDLGLLDRALTDVASLTAAPNASSAMAALARAELFLREGDVASASRHADDALRLARERPLPPTWAARAEFLAYPRAEPEAVAHAAARFHLSPLFVWSVMRQESRFALDAVSTSGALGLMQLLPKTAERIAMRLEEAAPSRPQMLQPERNIGYGAWYLAGLLGDVQHDMPLALISYNAGPVARDRWLSTMPSEALDIVIESIPKGETRRYTKIVLQNLGTYVRLYENGQLRLDPRVPTEIAHDIDF